jgi:hypothetical protein
MDLLWFIAIKSQLFFTLMFTHINLIMITMMIDCYEYNLMVNYMINTRPRVA